jgi:hypothetical protein
VTPADLFPRANANQSSEALLQDLHQTSSRPFRLSLSSLSERNEEMDVRKGPLDDLSCKILTSAHMVMLLTIVFHDADHCRQAMNWGYTIPLALWLVNGIVCLPNEVALLLTRHRRRSAALATRLAGLLIVVAFAQVHLLGADIPVWGIWNRSFFVLGVDAISWSILVWTVAVGIGVGMAGASVMGRFSPGAVDDSHHLLQCAGTDRESRLTCGESC